MCKKLTSLTFGGWFNQPVDGFLHVCKNLNALEFGERFNQSVDDLPSTLTSLKFGEF